MKTINVNIRRYMMIAAAVLALTVSGCSGYLQSNSAAQMFYGFFYTTSPVLNPLTLGVTTSTSITLNQPTLFTTGNPYPTVEAYIGPDGLITLSGSTVGGTITEGPVNVSAGQYPFNALAGNTVYRIIVVAQNSSGYSVQQITQSTGGIAPVMNALNISATTPTSITLDQPTFSTEGNPDPSGIPPQTRRAYLGLDGTISIAGSGPPIGFTQGPIDVSTAGYTFPGLSQNTAYRIIVVAQNASGYSVRQIVQSTGGTAPVLNALALTTFDNTSITLTQPTHSTAGNPTPTVRAYIGLDGTISVAGSIVSNYTDGPYDVSASAHQFTNLAQNTAYRIYVVSQNAIGFDVETIVQSTAGIAPVLDALALTTFDNTSITLTQPTFATAGNPAPTVRAYIGLNGTISVAGAVVSNYTDGPYDVSGGAHQFTNLAQNTAYRIYVVAQNGVGFDVETILQSTGGIAPVMNALATSGVTTTEITINQPTFSTTGNPTPTVRAYIGLNGTITVAGSVVSNFTDGPYDVSGGSHQFTSLAQNTLYRIYVVAQNGVGFDVETITQSTGGAAPVMNALATSGVTTTEITIDQPTFSTSGNPSPTVHAYIGLDGTISVAGAIVSNYTDGPYDVSTGAHQFTNLVQGTAYRIYVVAQNGLGFDVETIVQSTGGAAPALNALATSGVTTTAITIDQPTFATAGNPTPTVYAYIGFNGTISVAGSVVSNFTDGPYDVSGGSHQFTGLIPATSYRIYVVARNVVGFDVETITQSTGGAAPVMNALVTSGVTQFEITINQPTFSTTGNPTPTVYAYIGLDGTITATGSVISSYTDGPYDVSSGSHQFTFLTQGTPYRIYVVAKNVINYHVLSIQQNTNP